MGARWLVDLDKLVACSTLGVLGTRADHCSRADPGTGKLVVLEAWQRVVQGALPGRKSARGSKVARNDQPGVCSRCNLPVDFAKRKTDSGLDLEGSVVPGFLEWDLHSFLLVVFDFLKK